MPSRIDDRTMVPLGIVAALFGVGFSLIASGAFWVKSVNDRLSQIEDRLGIARAEPALIPNAEAKGR
jgi:hypothetical protein